MAKKRYSYYKRTFLNKKGFNSVAFILAEIDTDSYYNEIILSDCGKQISLDFSVHPDEYNNTIHKAKLLRDIFNEYYEELLKKKP